MPPGVRPALRTPRASWEPPGRDRRRAAWRATAPRVQPAPGVRSASARPAAGGPERVQVVVTPRAARCAALALRGCELRRLEAIQRRPARPQPPGECDGDADQHERRGTDRAASHGAEPPNQEQRRSPGRNQRASERASPPLVRPGFDFRLPGRGRREPGSRPRRRTVPGARSAPLEHGHARLRPFTCRERCLQPSVAQPSSSATHARW